MLIKRAANRYAASAQALTADYKAQGLDRQASWSQFVKDRGLKPEIDAKAFYAIFDNAAPIPLIEVSQVNFQPTHARSVRRPTGSLF